MPNRPPEKTNTLSSPKPGRETSHPMSCLHKTFFRALQSQHHRVSLPAGEGPSWLVPGPPLGAHWGQGARSAPWGHLFPAAPKIMDTCSAFSGQATYQSEPRALTQSCKSILAVYCTERRARTRVPFSPTVVAARSWEMKPLSSPRRALPSGRHCASGRFASLICLPMCFFLLFGGR